MFNLHGKYHRFLRVFTNNVSCASRFVSRSYGVSLAKLGLNKADRNDFYDESFVDGFKSPRREINLINNCGNKIWPGWVGKNGIPDGGGATLDVGASRIIHVPDNWESGRIWARTGCDDNFNCDTGGCGNSERCDGRTGENGVSVAEFTFKKDDPKDVYDISLVDGFNVQIKIKPNAGSGDYKEIGSCSEDLLNSCPNESKVEKNGRIVKCESACTKLQNSEYCCTGQHNTSETCHSTNFSRFFKDRCHDSYSYAYDDPSSTVVCYNANYEVRFC
uniref:Thaumatin-like protein n=1 Tax=Panagrellus redivivus TaxID=6233 RepID=A0A7E4VV47_PANRE